MHCSLELKKIPLRPRGKNSRFTYLVKSFVRLLVPEGILRTRYDALMESFPERADRQYIQERVDYYCRLTQAAAIRGDVTIGTMPKFRNNYFRDFTEYSRFFNQALKADTAFGDNTEVPTTPSLLKSRPITGAQEGGNAVLLNLNKVRHFVFLKDRRTFESKKNQAIFRGMADRPQRKAFMEKYFNTQWVDCGDTSGKEDNVPEEWRKPLITLYDHLKYKFVISIEGNDVATNLKWVMSSNSIAVMPKPKFETWFMEGRLIGGYHYIEIKDDYSDLPEKLTYYCEHPDEARAIIAHAHEYVDQFRDKDREDLIHLLVLKRYFELTNPQPAGSLRR